MILTTVVGPTIGVYSMMKSMIALNKSTVSFKQVLGTLAYPKRGHLPTAPGAASPNRHIDPLSRLGTNIAMWRH
jgi:hypothetical protein